MRNRVHAEDRFPLIERPRATQQWQGEARLRRGLSGIAPSRQVTNKKTKSTRYSIGRQCSEMICARPVPLWVRFGGGPSHQAFFYPISKASNRKHLIGTAARLTIGPLLPYQPTS